MALPTSGALSLNDIKGEFGGPTSPSLGDYYAGGSYVPAGTTGTNGAVPSSGTISISNFYGTSNAIIAFESYNLSAFELDPNDATCYYQINSNGSVYGTVGGTPFDLLEQWVTPTSQASNYEVFATLNSGTLSGGTTGSWLSLGTTRDWYVTQTSVGSKVAELSIQIRRIGTTSPVYGPVTINLEALVEI
jgi:hypothetical protein